jgi:hypothetical protein
VALLIAPVVVAQADNVAARVAIAAVAALVVAGAIWVSKTRRSELVVEARPAAAAEERARVEA